VAFSAGQLEAIAAWCVETPRLSSVRAAARRQFFGTAAARPIKYRPGADDAIGRERRFIGWFALTYRLPDGQRSAELAAEALYRGAELAEALDAVRGVRYMLAVVTSVDRHRTTFLELQDERFEVRSTTWARVMAPGNAVVAHLVPVRRRFWLPAPGWIVWPFQIGPNMRRELRQVQSDPIQIERFLQGRRGTEEAARLPEPPRDATLAEAVARMTAAAQAAGRRGLVLDVEEWRSLVLEHLSSLESAAFMQEIIRRAGDLADINELNQWLGLANNIWNNTPQPDRGSRTANEMLGEMQPPRT